MQTCCLTVLLSLAASAAGAVETPRPLEGLTDAQRREFEKGEKLFLTVWAPAPAPAGVRDGLGPFYHAASCVACHPGGGRGLSPDGKEPGNGLVFRLGTKDDDLLDEYGSQLSPLAVAGVKPEGSIRITWRMDRGTFPDGAAWSLRTPSYAAQDWQYGPVPEGVKFSPRMAPALFGSGLLEAVPQKSLQALADPDDRNGDGISGRLNLEDTWEGYDATVSVAGRFGWKAWMPTLLRQVCGALGEDMGVTNVFQPHDMTPAQSEILEDHARGGHGTLFEAGGRDPDLLAAYVRMLAPPSRRDLEKPAAEQGASVFERLHCAVCHAPELKTGSVRGVKPLSDQTIHPFTDLLLHDMGPALADGRPEAIAAGNEWRTAPLWGLAAAVNESGAGLFLHDGRARSLEEAILWHGGEAEKSRDAYKALLPAERAALLGWLRSL